MKIIIKEHLFDLIIIVLFTICVFFSLIFSFKPIIEIAENNFWNFFTEMLSFLPLLFILIGLLDVWVPKEAITKHIKEYSGIKGIFIVILLATLQAGPLYGAFPVAHLLWKKDAVIETFLFTWALPRL